MKRISVILLVLQTLSAVSSAQTTFEPGTMPVAYSERITDAELRQLQVANQASNQQATMKRKVAAAVVAPPAASAQTFEEASEFLEFRGYSTFVPKRAILYVPLACRPCVVSGLKGQLQLWGNFLPRNISWLQTFEVSLAEATGSKPIDPDRLKAAQRNNRILVAVIRGNPTSVARQASQPTD